MIDRTRHDQDVLPALHSIRFRRVANRYPRTVAEAYGGDIAQAQIDSDERVAATVARWEREQGWPVCDWSAIGLDEGRDLDR